MLLIATEIPDDGKVINLNVRGKRGNIVQVFPAVEYDFIPNRLEMTEEDYLHIQWTGSNTHNNSKHMLVVCKSLRVYILIQE